MNRKIAFVFAVLCAVFLVDAAEKNDLIFYWRRSSDEKCEPFTTYMIECNKCICGADGTPYCTKMGCIPSYSGFMQQLKLKKQILQQDLENYDKEDTRRIQEKD